METNIADILDYLLISCPPEVYSPKLAVTYLKLLKELEPMAVKPYTLELTGDFTHKIYIPSVSAARTRAKKIAVIGALAAACITTLFVNFAGSVVATPEQGYFYWLKKDEHGATFITNPESLDAATEQPNYSKSYIPEEVPAEYKDYIVDAKAIGAIEALQNYELQEVNILEEGNIRNVDSFLINQATEEKLSISVEIFPDKRLLVSETYGTHEYDVLRGEMEYKLFSKPNPTGGTDYVVAFYVDGKKYTLSNHDNSQQLIEIAIQYYQYIYNT